MQCDRLLLGLLGLLVAAATCLADEEPVRPESVKLTTKDGVVLRCAYYPGIADPQTVPIILIHGWSGPRGAGSGRDFDELAGGLQAAGHTVIAPDLRGHGGSTMRRNARGAQRYFRRDRLGPRDFAAMVKYDVEAVKKFLMTQHNQQKLNIELLCIIGAEMGAAVGANWAVQDWSWPSLPNLKQGQDVKALVLISPPQSFRSLSVQQALKFPPLQRMPLMIVYGEKNDDTKRESQGLYRQLKRYHPRTDLKKQQTLVVVEVPTSLQGTKLLNATPDTAKQIQDFVQWRLADRRERIPWRARSSS